MYRLVIAEKPSVAMSIAKVLGATARKEGHMEGRGSPVATSKCQRHLEAPTEPTGELLTQTALCGFDSIQISFS